MPARIWKFGFVSVTTRDDVPQGMMPDASWRLRLTSSDFSSPMVRRDLVDLYESLGGRLPMGADLGKPVIQNMILQKINGAAQRGDIVAFRRKAESSTPAGGTPGSGSGGPPPPPPPSSGGSSGGSSETEKTWVEVQLVDEEGNPIAGERYSLKITDGSTREGTLDAAGRVRVQGIDPGTCTLRFPDLDAKEYKRKS